jgi:hypothetical protein
MLNQSAKSPSLGIKPASFAFEKSGLLILGAPFPNSFLKDAAS